MVKKSEDLRRQMAGEDNDIKAFGIGGKIIREARAENFDAEWLPKFQEVCPIVFKEVLGCYQLENKKYGIMRYYPKANRLHLCQENRWVKPGLQWLVRNIL